MTTKTLNEIPPTTAARINLFSIRNGYIKLYEDRDLKQAAIEWILELENEDYAGLGMRWQRDVEVENWSDGYIMARGIIHWIKNFFDIKEGDLNDARNRIKRERKTELD